MRTIIQYLRSLFCKHEWQYLGEIHKYQSDYASRPVSIIRRWRCTKCGYAMKIKY